LWPVEGIPPTVPGRVTDEPPCNVGACEKPSSYERLADSLAESADWNELLKSQSVAAHFITLDTGDIEGG
jgi:hypothetical protein